MSEWYDNQKKPSSNFRKLLQERIAKANPRRTLTAKERKQQADSIKQWQQGTAKPQYSIKN